MGNYAAKMQRTASTTLSLGSVACTATTRRARIYDLMFGSEGAVGDQPFLYTVQRFSALGTATTVTPAPLDPADAACVTTARENYTVEPTYVAGAVVISCPINQRATFRWVAAPGGELVIPATSGAGYGVQTPTSSAVAITATAHFQE